MAAADEIGERIVRAVLTRRLAGGERLGESELATLFGCSRTIVREALIGLSARGIVAVRPRRGWFVAEPDEAEIHQAFEARLVIETGLLRRAAPLRPREMERIRGHMARQRAALGRDDIGQSTMLLGDFHVCLAECLGNRLLAAALHDLTVHTTLAALRHQTHEEALQSFAEHEEITRALEASDMLAAEASMASHLGSWRRKMQALGSEGGLERLRRALSPAA